MEPTDRSAGRVLLVDHQDRVLLFRGGDPAVPGLSYWFTPGGGLDPGETPAQGASRELYEETGLRLRPDDLGDPVHEEIAYFSFDGVRYRQPQEFFLVRVDSWRVDTTRLHGYEIDTIDGHRWWSAGELALTEDVFYPCDLVEILKRLGIPPC